MSRARTPQISAVRSGYQEVKKATMRRTLVLTDEASRHPFRATLPAHIRSNELEAPAECLWRLTQQDVRGFATVYLATFAAALAFIA